MADEWERLTLGEVCLIQIGRTPPRKEARYWTPGLERPFCTIADMADRRINPSREGVTEAAESEGRAKRVPAGSLLMSFKLTIGRVGFASRDLFPNEAIAWLRSTDPGLDERFLALWLEGQDLSEGSGRAVKGSTLNSDSLRAIPVAVPPLEVQRPIVDLIAAVDASIEALAAEAVAGADAEGPLIQALVDSGSEGVESLPLGEVGEFVRGRRFTKDEYVPSGLGCIHYGQIHTQFGPVARQSLTFLPEKSRSRLRLAHPGDVVIAATSEDLDGLGKATAWLGDDDVAVHDDCYIFRHRLDPKFASYVFASPWFQQQKRQYAGGTKVTRISGSDLAKIALPIPPIAVQIKVGEAMGALSDHVNAVRVELDAVRQLRASMLTALLSRRVEIPATYDELLNRVAGVHLEAS